jgi:regulator-associated protein of mTOR
MISVSVYKQLSHVICYSQVRASAVFALGTLVDVGFDSCRSVGDEECDDDDKFSAEVSIVKSLLSVASDGSPLVRAEVAVGR